MTIAVPLLLGILQVGLVLHVRNTLTAAASEGARFGAAYDKTPSEGAARTRQIIGGALADRFADDVTAEQTDVDGYSGVVVVVHARVPALGLFGPSIQLDVEGHAVEEALP